MVAGTNWSLRVNYLEKGRFKVAEMRRIRRPGDMGRSPWFPQGKVIAEYVLRVEVEVHNVHPFLFNERRQLLLNWWADHRQGDGMGSCLEAWRERHGYACVNQALKETPQDAPWDFSSQGSRSLKP